MCPRAAIGKANTPLPLAAIGKANTPLPLAAIGKANTPPNIAQRQWRAIASHDANRALLFSLLRGTLRVQTGM